MITVWLAWGKGKVKEEGQQAQQGPRRPPPAWPAGLALLLGVGGAAAFVAFYIVGNNSQELGGTMALAFLGLGFAVAYWGRDLSGDEVEVGRYPVPAAGAVRAGARRPGRRSATGWPRARPCSPAGGS